MTRKTLRRWAAPVLLIILMGSGFAVLDRLVRTAPEPDHKKTVTVCWGTEEVVNFGRVKPGEVLEVVVKKGCCEGVEGDVVIPSPMGWRGGGSGEQIMFTARVPENKSGVHIGLFRGTMKGCATAEGDGDGDDGKETASKKKEPWEVTAIGRIGEKEDPERCGIVTYKECVDKDTVLVSASIVGAIDALCRVKLVDQRDGEVIGSGRGIAFAPTDDETSHTIEAVSECCGSEKINISKDECGGGDGVTKDCCNLTVNAEPKHTCRGGETTVSAEVDLSERCRVKRKGKKCKIQFLVKNEFEAKPIKKTKIVDLKKGSGKVAFKVTPLETGTMKVKVRPQDNCKMCDRKTVEVTSSVVEKALLDDEQGRAITVPEQDRLEVVPGKKPGENIDGLIAQITPKDSGEFNSNDLPEDCFTWRLFGAATKNERKIGEEVQFVDGAKFYSKNGILKGVKRVSKVNIKPGKEGPLKAKILVRPGNVAKNKVSITKVSKKVQKVLNFFSQFFSQVPQIKTPKGNFFFNNYWEETGLSGGAQETVWLYEVGTTLKPLFGIKGKAGIKPKIIRKWEKKIEKNSVFQKFCEDDDGDPLSAEVNIKFNILSDLKLFFAKEGSGVFSANASLIARGQQGQDPPPQISGNVSAGIDCDESVGFELEGTGSVSTGFIAEVSASASNSDIIFTMKKLGFKDIKADLTIEFELAGEEIEKTFGPFILLESKTKEDISFVLFQF